MYMYSFYQVNLYKGFSFYQYSKWIEKKNEK